ncbi:MAG: histone deacetylase [Polyangiaceae bacterium]
MLIFTDDRMRLHDPGAHHPERPDRLSAATQALKGRPGLTWRAPTPASGEQVARIHDAAHVADVETRRGRRGAFDPDTNHSEDSVEAAYLAAGAAIDAVTAVVEGEAKHAFALVRPPGHHAEAQAAMGFCLFNNIAVAAAHARAALGVERVLIVDWDVHHGNGTQHVFEDRRDILFCSLHQYPFYPGTGAATEVGHGEGEGYTLNVPFPAGAGPTDYRAAFDDLILPVADAFAPDLVLVSAGYDAHRDDPLASMQLEDETYATLAGKLVALADRHAAGKLVLVLEGGYDLDALGRSVRATVDTLAGATAPPIHGDPQRGVAALREVRQAHRSRWKI